MSILAEIVYIPFRNPDIRVPKKCLRVEIGGEIQIIFIDLKFPLNEYHSIFERTVKLINKFRPFLIILLPNQPTTSSLHPSLLLLAVKPSKRHHLLYLVGIEMVAELLQMHILNEGGVVHFIEEEGYHDDLVVFFLEEVALQVSFLLVFLEDLVLHVVVAVNEVLDLDYPLLVADVVFIVT